MRMAEQPQGVLPNLVFAGPVGGGFLGHKLRVLPDFTTHGRSSHVTSDRLKGGGWRPPHGLDQAQGSQ